MAKTRAVMVAKYANSLKLDGRVSGPEWAETAGYDFELPLGIYAKEPESMRKTLGDQLREKGSVKLLWNEEYLYVGAVMDDSDVVAEGKADQTHLYQMGDLVEVFLKPENETYYWEIYGAPNRMKTAFFFPGRGRLFVPGCAEYMMDLKVHSHIDGTLNNWHDKDKGWSVEIAIPLKSLTEFGAKFDNSTNWTILVSRYNYSRYLPLKELSSAPRLSAPNFHLLEDYASLVLEE